MGDGFSRFANDLKRNWVAVIGFALFCIMLRQPYFGSILSNDLVSVHGVRGVLDGAIIAVAIIVLLAGKRVEFARYVRALLVAASMFSALGVCMLAAASGAGTNLEWISFIGAFSCAVGFVLIAASWMHKLAGIASDSLVPLALLSFTVSLLAVVADVFDGPVKVFVNVLIPIGSALCAACMKDEKTPVERRKDDDAMAHVIMLVIVLMIIEILCCSILRGTWSSGGVGYGGVSSKRIHSYLVSAAYGILLLLLVLAVKHSGKSISLISVISLAAVIALIVIMATAGRLAVGPYTTSLYSVLLVVMFAALSLAVRRGFASGFTCAGLFCAFFAFISLVSYTLLPYLFYYDNSQAEGFVLPVSLVSALVVAVGICVVIVIRLRAQMKALRGVLGDSAETEMWDELALLPVVFESPVYVKEEEALDVSVRKAAELYLLTSREADIVKLFAQGRTIKQTATELHLAPSTVQGYTKSIYAKLGVHGKDEIRDLLQSLVKEA